ncbi:hypothetical protein Cadr_000025323 [Camelus dromedarius]|uniref:Uncharacterized protein n=1 Tax=Camelus dromedarius TaxID=9838 RepID=A0A5N4CLX7_CAMDR|nr:hypothetical protein Cadr_000025323 [Camelus dromedarius]
MWRADKIEVGCLKGFKELREELDHWWKNRYHQKVGCLLDHGDASYILPLTICLSVCDAALSGAQYQLKTPHEVQDKKLTIDKEVVPVQVVGTKLSDTVGLMA